MTTFSLIFSSDIKKWLLFLILLEIPFFLQAAQNDTDSTEDTVQVDSRVEQDLDARGEARVIITLHDPAAVSENNDKRGKAVKFAQEQVLKNLPGVDFSKKHQYKQVPALAGTLTRAALNALRHHPQVASIEIDEPVFASLNFAVPLIKADQVQTLNPTAYTGAGVYVAVIDSGVDTDHPDLANDIVAQQCFTQAGCPPSNSYQGDSAEDDDGHGTHVTGIITSEGVVAPKGVAPAAKIVAVKVLKSDGSGYTSDTIAALDWIRTHLATYPVKVVNMSLGGGTYSTVCDYSQPSYANALNLLATQGVTIFAASGNDDKTSAISSPACMSHTIAVGATYKKTYTSIDWYTCVDAPASVDKVACFSNSNLNLLDLLAPGAMITSSWIDGVTSSEGGTSMASPVAAGVAALLLEANPNLTSTSLLNALKGTGVPIRDTRNNGTFPRVDALAAVKAVLLPIPAPSDFTATAVSETQINLSWTDNSENDTVFRIERPANTLLTTVSGNSLGTGNVTYSHTGLYCNTLYSYLLKAVNYGGDSSSVTAQATTSPCASPPSYSSTPAVGHTVYLTTTIPGNVVETVSVQNPGVGTLNVSSITLGGTHPNKFTITPTSFTIPGGGGNQTMTIQCNGSEVGTYTATLTLTHNAAGSPATYNLSCRVKPPTSGYASVPNVGNPINFNTLSLIGTYRSLTVRETGTATLSITSISFEGPQATQFMVRPNRFSVTYGGGISQIVNLRCYANEAGTYNATLVVNHNAPDSPATYPVTCVVR